MDKQNNVPGIKLLVSESSTGSGSGVGSYIPTETYAINDIVNYNGIFYKCIQAGVGKQPDTNPDYWTIYDENLGTFDITDPAVNAAVATSVIDGYAGVNVILTGAPNGQTLQDPTNTVESKQFIIINDRTSTDNLVITIPYGDIIIEPAHAQKFIWNGSEWVLGSSNDAKDVTYIPQGGFNDANVQDVLDGLEDGSNYITTLDYRSLAIETSSRKIYLDPAGSDNNDGLTAGTPIFSVHEAMKRIKPVVQNCIITLEFADGTYDYTALGKLVIDKILLGTGQIKFLSSHATFADKFTVLDSGTFESNTADGTHTDTDKAWAVDQYYKKWLRPKTMISGGLPSETATRSLGFGIIYKNTADTLYCGFAGTSSSQSLDFADYEIVEAKIHLNFGSNEIFVTSQSTATRGLEFNQIDLTAVAISYLGYYYGDSTESIMHFVNCVVNGTFYFPNYEGFNSCIVGSTASIIISEGYNMNYIQEGVSNPAFKSFGTSTSGLINGLIVGKNNKNAGITIEDGGSKECHIKYNFKAVNLTAAFKPERNGLRLDATAILYHEGVDYTVHAANEMVLMGGEPTFGNEPSTARFTTNGSSEADYYYDAEKNINVLSIAPDAYKELYMSLFPIDYRDVAKETADRTIYIATTGNDESGTGEIGTPFASIHRALKDIKTNIANQIITIRASFGTYDFSALGDLDLSRFFYNGGRLLIKTESDIQDDNYNVIDTGTFTSNTRFSHTDSGKAWGADAYDGKFARFDSQTTYKRFMPIVKNNATVLDTGNPINTSSLSGAYGIVDHKVIFNFGTNDIIYGDNYRGVTLFENVEVNLNGFVGNESWAYTGFESKMGIIHFTNCKVVTAVDSAYAPIIGFGSYFHCSTDGTFAPVYSNACTFSNNNGVNIVRPYLGNTAITLGGTLIRGKNSTKTSVGVYALGTCRLTGTDLKGINLKILVYLRDNQYYDHYKQIEHEDVLFTFRSSNSNNILIHNKYTGLFGGSFDTVFNNEPDTGRLTIDGSAAATQYFDQKKSMNALDIAPDGYKVATIPDIWTDSNDPTGVVNQSDVSISFVAATRVVTVQPSATSFTIYSAGKKFVKTGTDTVTLDAATNGYFVYYDNNGVLQKSTSLWNFTTDVPIAYVIYNHTLVDGFALNERHGIQMSGATHLHLHKNVGTYKYSGFGIADYTAQPAAPADADNRYSIATGVVADEDLHTTLSALSAGGPYTYFYKDGASGEWKWNKTSVNPFAVGTNIQINEWTGATWQLADIANNNFANTWLFAVPSLDSDFEFIIVLDQDEHTNLGEAQSQTIEELDLTGLPFVELCLLYKITWGAKASYSTVGNCRIESVVELVGTAAQILGTAGSSHGTLSGLTNDDHPQYLDRNAVGTIAISGGAISIDMNNKDRTYGNVILTEDITINNPTNIAIGSILSVEMTQDATGGWSLSWGSYFTGENGTIPAPTGTGLKSTSYTFEAKTATKLVLKDVVFNY